MELTKKLNAQHVLRRVLCRGGADIIRIEKNLAENKIMEML